jgi:hypothetical protein
LEYGVENFEGISVGKGGQHTREFVIRKECRMGVQEVLYTVEPW